MESATFLPAMNAAMNAAALLFIVSGRLAIRRGKKRAHRTLMLLALAASTLFLAGYLLHHALHGVVRYQGTGRALYLFILATHTILAMLVVPLVLTALYRALRGRIDQHRRIVRFAFPCWLYVSATGVIIYLMLYQL